MNNLDSILLLQIGCGFINDESYNRMQKLVCDYFPPGNVVLDGKALPAYEVNTL